MDDAFLYVMDTGITTEEHYPYTGKDGKCKLNPKHDELYIKDFQVYFIQETDEQLFASVQRQPISLAVNADNWQFYKEGILDDCDTTLNHCALLVGAEWEDHWKAKNSWGADWGEEGFIRLAWGNTCGIENYASFPI